MTDMIKEFVSGAGMYVWFVIVAMFGGTANYISKVKANREKAFSVAELMGEWVISGVAGLLTAYLAQGSGLSFEFTAACCGVAGHAGGRAFYIIEQAFLSRLGVESQSQPRTKED